MGDRSPTPRARTNCSRSGLLSVLALAACNAEPDLRAEPSPKPPPIDAVSDTPPSHDEPPSVDPSLEAPPPASSDVVPPANDEVEPEPVVPLSTLATEACKLPRYTSAEALCRHGIMPTHPFGRCVRLDDDRKLATTHGVTVEQSGADLGEARAQLYLKGYAGSGYGDEVTVYLGFRHADGSNVLLGQVFDYSSAEQWNPVIERVQATPEAVSVDYSIERIVQAGPSFREKGTLRCLATPSGWDCGHGCPKAKPALPPLSCTAVAKLPGRKKIRRVPGEVEDWEWFVGGRYGHEAAIGELERLGLAKGDDLDEPVSYRTYDFSRTKLEAFEFPGNLHVLTDGSVPLLTGHAPIVLYDAGRRLVAVTANELGESTGTEIQLASHRVFASCDLPEVAAATK